MASSQFDTRAVFLAPLSVATVAKVPPELPSLPSTRPRLRQREPTRGAAVGLWASKTATTQGQKCYSLGAAAATNNGTHRGGHARFDRGTPARQQDKNQMAYANNQYGNGVPAPMCSPPTRNQTVHHDQFQPLFYSVKGQISEYYRNSGNTLVLWALELASDLSSDDISGTEKYLYLGGDDDECEDEVKGGGEVGERPSVYAYQHLKAKAIKRMAVPHEIPMVMDKEGNEVKAKRACQQKVYQHHWTWESSRLSFNVMHAPGDHDDAEAATARATSNLGTTSTRNSEAYMVAQIAVQVQHRRAQLQASANSATAAWNNGWCRHFKHSTPLGLCNDSLFAPAPPHRV
ncbi:hypothetical protein MBLNU13_g05227t1 [Cladosporium sp. NU13]